MKLGLVHKLNIELGRRSVQEVSCIMCLYCVIDKDILGPEDDVHAFCTLLEDKCVCFKK